MKGTLVILSGIPGSGKSTFAEKYAKEHGNAVIVSTDSIREKFFGDANLQYEEKLAMELLARKGIDTSGMDDEERKYMMSNACHNLVFGKAYNMARAFLGAGKCVVFDSTALSKKDRKRTLDMLKESYILATCIQLSTPMETAIERDKARERTVGEDVIKRMYEKFTEADDSEGFAFVEHITT